MPITIANETVRRDYHVIRLGSYFICTKSRSTPKRLGHLRNISVHILGYGGESQAVKLALPCILATKSSYALGQAYRMTVARLLRHCTDKGDELTSRQNRYGF